MSCFRNYHSYPPHPTVSSSLLCSICYSFQERFFRIANSQDRAVRRAQWPFCFCSVHENFAGEARLTNKCSPPQHRTRYSETVRSGSTFRRSAASLEIEGHIVLSARPCLLSLICYRF